ncbi:unnamed protein product [Arabidopsis halleri]
MGEAGRKRGRAKGSRKRKRDGDWISDLPESLLCKVLLNLPTKDVVRTSVLSKRWKNIWKCVPGLDLSGEDIKMYYIYVRFVNRFLKFNRKYHIESFKLSYPGDGNCEPELDLMKRWITTVIQLKVKNLEFFDYSWANGTFDIPPSIYTCNSLVYLKLSTVTMSTVKSVSLPSLRVLKLSAVKFADHLDFETLISGCTALETLVISYFDRVEVLRVCSQSLLSFTHVAHKRYFTHVGHKRLAEEDLSIVIDAPRLEYLKLSDHQTASFIIKNSGSLVAVDINIVFNLSFGLDPRDLPKRSMIRNFLVGISCVKNMIISSITLEVIYDYLRCEPLPLFRNLSFLRVKFYNYSLKMLPTFLESCPNLISLVMGSTKKHNMKEISLFSRPQGFLPSLEYVEIKVPLKGVVVEIMKLVGYFLEKSTILKKLTLCLDDSRKTGETFIRKELLTIPRISTSCQVLVL